MAIEISARKREAQGTGASRRLRRESKVPGILYGAGKDAQPIEVDHKDLWFKLKMEAFHASILDMEIGAEKAQVLLRDYQMHPFRPLILHVDFQRVAADKKIHMNVPLHFVNAEVSPGVKVAGGVRTSKQAIQYLVMLHETLGVEWLVPALFRIGASTLLNDVLMQLEKERTGRYAGPDYFTVD